MQELRLQSIATGGLPALVHTGFSSQAVKKQCGLREEVAVSAQVERQLSTEMSYVLGDIQVVVGTENVDNDLETCTV